MTGLVFFFVFFLLPQSLSFEERRREVGREEGWRNTGRKGRKGGGMEKKSKIKEEQKSWGWKERVKRRRKRRRRRRRRRRRKSKARRKIERKVRKPMKEEARIKTRGIREKNIIKISKKIEKKKKKKQGKQRRS